MLSYRQSPLRLSESFKIFTAQSIAWFFGCFRTCVLPKWVTITNYKRWLCTIDKLGSQKFLPANFIRRSKHFVHRIRLTLSLLFSLHVVRLNVGMIGASYDRLDARGIPDYFTVVRCQLGLLFQNLRYALCPALRLVSYTDIDTIDTCLAWVFERE